MDDAQARRLFTGEKVVRFAASAPDDRPYLMPVATSTLDDGDAGVVVFAVDEDSLATGDVLPLLARLARLPRVSLLADQCGIDEAPLWWVQASAVAEVLTGDGDDPRFDRALAALEADYPHNRYRPPPMLVVWSTITAWRGVYNAAT